MAVVPAFRSLFGRLSVRLLLLTVFFVMLVEVLIFLPSMSRYRLSYLEGKIDAARLAVFALEATPDQSVSPELAGRLLADVGARGIVVHEPDKALMLDTGSSPAADAVFDLRARGALMLIADTVATLRSRADRTLRIIDVAPKDPSLLVEVLIEEAPLRRELWDYGRGVLAMSLLISLATGALLFVSLQWLLVAPLHRLIGAMVAFGKNPEDAPPIPPPTRRGDEIGAAQRELAAMQETVRQALRQKERLAALGTAVAKVNHDLRGILATAQLMSESLAASAAPEVRRVAPKLFAAIDRAVALCTQTLTFTREGAPPLTLHRFPLAPLVGELAALVERPADDIAVAVDVPAEIAVDADRDQLFRALHNLARNAVEAGAHRLSIAARAEGGGVAIEVADDGPGLPPKARDNLFRPFAGSARPGGAGLGLAIAREILRAHGGDLVLGHSTAAGTVFRLHLRGARQEAADPVGAPAGG
jgi:signal transduction histidine kinase